MPLSHALAAVGEIPDLIELEVVLPPWSARSQRLLQHVAMADGAELQGVHRGQHLLAAHCRDGGLQFAACGRRIGMDNGRMADLDGGHRDSQPANGHHECAGNRGHGRHFHSMFVYGK